MAHCFDYDQGIPAQRANVAEGFSIVKSIDYSMPRDRIYKSTTLRPYNIVPYWYFSTVTFNIKNRV